MAKRDWRKLLARYERANHKKKVSIKVWCERNNLPYTQTRKNFSMIRAEMREELASFEDQISNTLSSLQDIPDNASTPTSEEKSEEKRSRRKGHGLTGNKNAVVSGIYQDFFGRNLWAAAPGMTREMRYQEAQARKLRAIENAGKYQRALDEIAETIEQEERAPSEGEIENMASLQGKIESCLAASSKVNIEIESMDNNQVNREATTLAMEKMKAEIKQKNAATRKTIAEAIARERLNENAGGDSELRELQVKLAKANIDKAHQQSKLTEVQIEKIQHEIGAGDDDDLSDITEERDQLLSQYDEKFDG